MSWVSQRIYLVREVPQRDSNALLDGIARPDDGLVVRSLLRQARRIRRLVQKAHVELRDSNLNAERHELFHVLLECGGDLADGEVRLDADAVDGDAFALERLYEVLERRRLRT